MTTATMQSTFLTKENFNTQKTYSEISEHERKKLNFLLRKTKEAELFEKKFYELENLETEFKIIKQWNLIHSFAKSFIEQAKTSPI